MHTPGPWRVGITINKGDVWKGWRETDINGPEGCFLSLVQYHAAEEADANAVLISAAPDMLDILQSVYDRTRRAFYDDEPDPEDIEQFQRHLATDKVLSRLALFLFRVNPHRAPEARALAKETNHARDL